MKETEVAIKQLKCKTAPGPDGVTNDMIKHLGPAIRKTLLELFKESWRSNQLLPHQPPESPSRVSGQEKIDIISGRTENTFTNTVLID